MTSGGINVALLLRSVFLLGLAKVPGADEIRSHFAFYDDACTQTCKHQPERVRVQSVRCRSISERALRTRKNLEWDVEGGAICTYRLGLPDALGEIGWTSRRNYFVLRRYACGVEGQETDLWCFVWNVEKPRV